MTEPKKPVSVAEQLSQGVSPTTAAVVAGTAPVSSLPKDQAADVLGGLTGTKLLQLLLGREARDAAKEEQLIASQAAKDAQRTRNSRDQDSKQLLKQARCKHLKGGKRGLKNQNLDYAVASHIFIDSVIYIRCLVCGMKWYPKDTVEYLERTSPRTGKVSHISNHTHIGWLEANKMSQQSTNSQTMSERLVTTMARSNPADFQQQLDTTGGVIPTSVVDLEGNLVEDVQL